MNRFVGPVLILLCTLIWGSAFVAQKTGAEHYAPFTLTCYRNLLAGAFLAAVICLRNRIRTGRAAASNRTGRALAARPVTFVPTALAGGALSGVALFAAMAAQQLGIESTTPGISSFLTANYILIVPFLAWIVGKGRPRRTIWFGVVLALVGTYLICCYPAASEGTPRVEPASQLASLGGYGGTVGAGDVICTGGAMGEGELWTILCAFLFAVQIMVVDRFASKCDVLVFSMVQLFVAGLCAAPFMLLPSEASRLTLAHFKAGWFSLFYVGILSSGIAYTLQNLGQARTPPALAAIVMSFESVVGAVSGYLFFGDVLATAQTVGCVLVFTAIAFTSACDAKR